VIRLTPRGGDEYHQPVIRRTTLVGADTANLWVPARAAGRVDTIPYFQLAKIEVRSGSHSRQRVVIVSAAIGASVELAASLLDARFFNVSLHDRANRRTLLRYTARGVIWGGLLGAVIPRERWRAVSPPLSLSPDAPSPP
jgi:hypothetical protein